jgi:glycogen debranching enzyme
VGVSHPQSLGLSRKALSMPNQLENWDYFWTLGVAAVKELETERGILASARHELFGAIFGRDSLITSLNLLRVYQQTGQPEFLHIVRKVLTTLVELQGKDRNIESGEEPGKIIHEYRPDKHEHLTQAHPENGHAKPWYLYPDQIMRNYDTVDATPLFLITLYRYIQILENEGRPDPEFFAKAITSVKAGINWLFWYGDSNDDGFIDYQVRPQRTFGGLTNQNWMDSIESTFHESGEPVPHPIAPVEAQAYTYLALRLWAKHFSLTSRVNGEVQADRDASRVLHSRANELKERFNQQFIVRDKHGLLIAAAIDGAGQPLKNARSSMGHCLWAALNERDDGELDGIILADRVDDVVKRLMSPDLFEPEAGIRTLSRLSLHYQANSYHNGSIWPHDNSMIADGLENYRYLDEAGLLRIALLKAIAHFQNPLELFVYDESYADYSNDFGQRASQTQAWAAAAILNAVAPSFAASAKD